MVTAKHCYTGNCSFLLPEVLMAVWPLWAPALLGNSHLSSPALPKPAIQTTWSQGVQLPPT